MESSTDRLVGMLDEERTGHKQAMNNASRFAQQIEGHQRTLDRVQKEAHDARQETYAWRKWRDDLKAKVPKAKQADWPVTPDHDDIPF